MINRILKALETIVLKQATYAHAWDMYRHIISKQEEEFTEDTARQAKKAAIDTAVDFYKSFKGRKF